MRLTLTKTSSSKEKLNKKESKSDAGEGIRTHLYLNVYDISPINKYLYWFGLGIFHSGIEVHGMEYGYGAHEYPSSGVFEVEPRSCPGFTFRRSMHLGTTDMSRAEFRTFLENLSESYHGDTYHLIVKNCNHFTNDVCTRLVGRGIPRWVNRLAKLGSICTCVLPDSIKVNAVGDLTNPTLSGDDLDLMAALEAEHESELLDDHLLTTTPNSDVAPPPRVTNTAIDDMWRLLQETNTAKDEIF
ncbi:hypothetical protein LUZ60_014390 [Juncus effusus]|nr:hypothetical protein LUZ60_014390 [Juncus effusus]